jgi:hypothetical protein
MGTRSIEFLIAAQAPIGARERTRPRIKWAKIVTLLARGYRIKKRKHRGKRRKVVSFNAKPQ